MNNIPDKFVYAIVTDLPYEQTARNVWDSKIPFEPLWQQYKRIIKDNGAVILFGNGMFTVCKPVVELLNHIKGNNIDNLLSEIDEYIEKYHLSKENREGYLKLREDYNSGYKTPIKFYTLLCYAFNNQIRFNKNGEYNTPFGKNRSSFNPTLREKFIDFHQRVNDIDCIFFNMPYEKFDFFEFHNNDFVYCDPPYLNSIATYNEQSGWTEKHEALLLKILDELNEKGVSHFLR